MMIIIIIWYNPYHYLFIPEFTDIPHREWNSNLFSNCPYIEMKLKKKTFWDC